MAELHASPGARRPGLRCARIGLMLAAVASAVCGALPAAAQSDPSPGYATRPFTPPNFRMPEGQGCAGDVARWKAVQDNDYSSGNIGLKVYHQIQDEIARAEAACTAGHDGQARAMVAASKRRHGYPD